MRGVALLISVIVLGAIFATFAVLSAQGVLYETSALQIQRNKKTASAAAEACLEAALYRAASDINYAGGENISVGGASCTIRALYQLGSDWIIETEATVNNRVSRLRATLTDRSPATIESIQEIGVF